jgi:cytochrome c biogenesis protein CcmG, thiol:disulfide interchange protein DsbE
LFFVAFLSLNFSLFSQQEEGKKLPSVLLKDMNGNEVNTSNLGLKGPVILVFWASWCSACKNELSVMADLYDDWKKETGVNFVMVSVDDEKTKNGVPTLVNGKGWEYLVIMDPNGEFKRAMGVNRTPHTFLLDENGSIVYTRNGYTLGDEDILYEEILKLTKK